MKKIRIVMNDLQGGGAEKVLVKILDKLSDKYEIDLFLIDKVGVYLESIPLNVKLKYNFEPLKAKNIFYKIIFSLKSRIKNRIYKYDKAFIYNLEKKNYDYEISFLEGPSAEIVSKSKSLSSKKIAWIHTDISKHRTMSIQKEREIYKKFHKIICVSNQARDSFVSIYPEYKNKVRVIFNPIDITEILKLSNQKLNLNTKFLKIVCVGRLIKIKGQDLLLKAFNNLIKRNYKVKLFLIGEGPEKEEIKKYVVKNNLEEFIEIVGFQKNPYPYIKKSDIFVLPSRYEGFPLVLSEAIILEKPIISTQCTGVNEILDYGKYGIQIPVDDYKALELELEELILSKNKRENYSKKSKERKTFFDLEKVINQIDGIFNE